MPVPKRYDPNATGPKKREESYWIWLPYSLVPMICASGILIGILSVEVVVAQSMNHNFIVHFYQMEEHAYVTHYGMPALIALIALNLLYNFVTYPNRFSLLALLFTGGGCAYFYVGVYPTLMKFIKLKLPRDEIEYEKEHKFLHHSHEHFILLWMLVVVLAVRPYCNWAKAKKDFEEKGKGGKAA
jgi:hypothetical protein